MFEKPGFHGQIAHPQECQALKFNLHWRLGVLRCRCQPLSHPYVQPSIWSRLVTHSKDKIGFPHVLVWSHSALSEELCMWLYMEVSSKIGVPPVIIHFSGIFHSIHFGVAPCTETPISKHIEFQDFQPSPQLLLGWSIFRNLAVDPQDHGNDIYGGFHRGTPGW